MIVKLKVVPSGMPGHNNWQWPDGRGLACNVPAGESPRLPRGWEWVDYRTIAQVVGR